MRVNELYDRYPELSFGSHFPDEEGFGLWTLHSLHWIASCLRHSMASLDFRPPCNSLIHEAINDLCYNSAAPYVHARGGVCDIQVRGSAFYFLLQRIYDNPLLFPALHTLRLTSPDILREPSMNYYAPNLRARRIYISDPYCLFDVVRRAECDELHIGCNIGYVRLVNRYARIVVMRVNLFDHEFSNMRTLCICPDDPLEDVCFSAVSGYPLLEAVLFVLQCVQYYTAAVEQIPTLQWLPMTTNDVLYERGWQPLLPLVLPETRVWSYTMRVSDFRMRELVAIKSPHLLPQLDAPVYWRPAFRYSRKMNMVSGVFLLAIDRLVSGGSVAYADPAVIECILRCVSSFDDFGAF